MKGLDEAGRKLWRWLRKNYDTTDCEPLVIELCIAADRLAEIRQLLREADRPLDKTRLMAAEAACLGRFLRIWKELGLSDDDTPPMSNSELARHASMQRWSRAKS